MISLQGTGLVAGYFGNLNIINVNVSNIDIQAATPYLEVTGYQFQGVVDSPKNFSWLWLSSSYDFESRSEMAQPLRTSQGNASVIYGYLVYYQQTFPPQGEPKMNLVTVDESRFRIGFMLAFTTNVTFTYPQMYLNFESNSLGDQWTHTENYERFDTPPDNATLANWGLHPNTFWYYENQLHYQTFYIYEFSLTRAGPFIERMNLIYIGPAYVLLLVLIISIIALIFKGIKLGDAIAFYFGSAFFSLSFLLSYIQLGIGPVLYIEYLMELDTYAAVLLAGLSMGLRIFGREDNESAREWWKRVAPKRKKIVEEAKSAC
jgi:hypothetical protein